MDIPDTGTEATIEEAISKRSATALRTQFIKELVFYISFGGWLFIMYSVNIEHLYSMYAPAEKVDLFKIKE